MDGIGISDDIVVQDFDHLLKLFDGGDDIEVLMRLAKAFKRVEKKAQLYDDALKTNMRLMQCLQAHTEEVRAYREQTFRLLGMVRTPDERERQLDQHDLAVKYIKRVRDMV